MHMMVLGFMILVPLLVGSMRVVWADDIALPDDVHIIPPAPDVPQSYAAFSGAWIGGAWTALLPCVHCRTYHQRGGCYRRLCLWGCAGMAYYSRVDWTTGTITHGQLQFTLRGGNAHVQYRHESKTKLLGFYDTDRTGSFVSLVKTDVTTTAAIRRVTQGLQTRMDAETLSIPLTVHDDVLGVPKELKLSSHVIPSLADGTISRGHFQS